MGKIRKGIDVSAWQGDIDWGKVAASGVEFAIIRCGVGTDKPENDDKYFAKNYAGAKSAGLLVGVYLYSYAKDDAAAKSEAEHVLRLLKNRPIDLPVYYDLEQSGCESAYMSNAKIFGDIIEKAGYWCGIYANTWHWSKYLKGLDRFTRWMANWEGNKTTDINRYGDVARPVGADIHQFSSVGKIPGIKGNVDLDVMYRDLPADMGVKVETDPLAKYTDEQLAEMVLEGRYGNGEARKKALGKRYSAVQKIVNEMAVKPTDYVTVDGDTVSTVAEKTGNNELTELKVVPGQKVKIVKSAFVDWDKVKYFERSEFACKCKKYCDGFPVEPEPELVELCDKVRGHFASPMNISSGVRCEQHNVNVGGVEHSRHKQGKAVDFRINGKTAKEVLAYVQSLPEVRYAYAIDSLYVHMDVR